MKFFYDKVNFYGPIQILFVPHRGRYHAYFQFYHITTSGVGDSTNDSNFMKIGHSMCELSLFECGDRKPDIHGVATATPLK